MSDPMTNLGDTEDVLASIRRLVADTHKARRAMSEGVSTPPANAAGSPPELFLLTSDFMVEEAEATPEPEVSTQADEGVAPLVLGPEQAIQPVVPGEVATDEVVAESDAEGVAGEASFEAPSDEAPAEIQDETPRAPIDLYGELEAWDSSGWDAPTYDDTPEAKAAEHAAELTLEERIAELEQAVGTHDTEFEPDGSENLEAEVPQEVPASFVLAQSIVPVAPEAAQTPNPDPAPAPFEEAEAFQEHEPQAVEPQFVPEHEPEIEQDEVEAEAELETEAQFETVEDVQDPQSDDGDAIPAAAYVADDPEPAPADEANYIDEAMLRELVADVLNSELRGHLGERMTRNIRRLVKREVARALAMRDLR